MLHLVTSPGLATTNLFVVSIVLSFLKCHLDGEEVGEANDD